MKNRRGKESKRNQNGKERRTLETLHAEDTPCWWDERCLDARIPDRLILGHFLTLQAEKEKRRESFILPAPGLESVWNRFGSGQLEVESQSELHAAEVALRWKRRTVCAQRASRKARTYAAGIEAI